MPDPAQNLVQTSLFPLNGRLNYLERLQRDTVHQILCFLPENEFWQHYLEIIYHRHLYPGLHTMLADPHNEFWKKFITAHCTQQTLSEKSGSPLVQLRKFLEYPPAVKIVLHGLELKCDFYDHLPPNTFSLFYDRCHPSQFKRLPLPLSLYLPVRKLGWRGDTFANIVLPIDQALARTHKKTLILLACAAKQLQDIELYTQAGWLAELANDCDIQLARCIAIENESAQIAALLNLVRAGAPNNLGKETESISDALFRHLSAEAHYHGHGGIGKQVIEFAALQSYNIFFAHIDLDEFCRLFPSQADDLLCTAIEVSNEDLTHKLLAASKYRIAISNLYRSVMPFVRAIQSGNMALLQMIAQPLFDAKKWFTTSLPHRRDHLVEWIAAAIHDDQRDIALWLLNDLQPQLPDELKLSYEDYHTLLFLCIRNQCDLVLEAIIREFPSFEKNISILNDSFPRVWVLAEIVAKSPLNPAHYVIELLLESGYGQHVGVLLEKGYHHDIVPYSPFAYNLLRTALERKDSQGAAALVANHLVLDLNAKDSNGNLIFDHIVHSSNSADFSLLQLLLNDPRCDLRQTNSRTGKTLAHLLASFSQYDDETAEATLRILFSRPDFQCDLEDAEEFTPLHRAAKYGNTIWIKIFCETQKSKSREERLALLNHETKGKTVLTLACESSARVHTPQVLQNLSSLLEFSLDPYIMPTDQDLVSSLQAVHCSFDAKNEAWQETRSKIYTESLYPTVVPLATYWFMQDASLIINHSLPMPHNPDNAFEHGVYCFAQRLELNELILSWVTHYGGAFPNRESNWNYVSEIILWFLQNRTASSLQLQAIEWLIELAAFSQNTELLAALLHHEDAVKIIYGHQPLFKQLGQHSHSTLIALALAKYPDHLQLQRLGVTIFELHFMELSTDKQILLSEFSNLLSRAKHHLPASEQPALNAIAVAFVAMKERCLIEFPASEQFQTHYTLLLNYLKFKSAQWPEAITHPLLSLAVGLLLGIAVACATAALLYFTFGVVPLMVAAITAGTSASTAILTSVGMWKVYRCENLHNFPAALQASVKSPDENKPASLQPAPGSEPIASSAIGG